MDNPPFLFAMTGARRFCGGIATTNLNILHALVELAVQLETGLAVFSFAEAEDDRPDFLPDWVQFRPFRGDKLSYALQLLRVSVRKPVFFFDHVRLALPLLPVASTGATKSIIFAHGSESWKRLRKTSRWSFQRASLCLTNSQFTLRKMRERISHVNAIACPLGMSPQFALNTGIPEPPTGTTRLEAADGVSYDLKDRVLLLVGRMHPREREKGHYQLIWVLPEILKLYPEVQLVFPGPGEDRKNLQELAQSRGVASAVFLPGLLSIAALTQLYRRCYAFVMPSEQEGFGLAYLEAMNYGKACVGCYDQGAEDVIVHDETGFLIYDPKDSQELLATLCNLLSDPERAGALGRAGFARLHQYFTSRHYQTRLKEAISREL